MLRIYTVQPGKHDFWPPEPRTPHLSGGLSWQWDVVFDASCRYNITRRRSKGLQQGGGVSLRMLSNNRDAVMWAWRYNPKIDRIDLTLYVNRGGKIEIGGDPGLVLMFLPIAEKARLVLTYSGGGNWSLTVFHLDQDDKVLDRETAYNNIKTPAVMWRLGLWFGGNRPAPQKMQVWVDFKR
jgi:hypothetical protein